MSSRRADPGPGQGRGLDRAGDTWTAQQWLSALNERVFFWLHPQRLDQLLKARRNRGRPHDVLVIDTASLVGYREVAIAAGLELGPGGR